MKTSVSRVVLRTLLCAIAALVSLQVRESSQSIEMTEQTPLLRTQTATMGQVVDSKQVEEMPLDGRNPINLAALDPAVMPEGGTAGSAAQAGVNGKGIIRSAAARLTRALHIP
jgi:hypothetical protein